jgi:hypothetical protein
MMLAAVEAVTKADPVWPTRCDDADLAAQATAREPVHAAPPPRSSEHIFTTNSTVIAIAGGG